jgi:hypothetical protein
MAEVVRRHSAAATFKWLPGRVVQLRMVGPLTAGALTHFAQAATESHGYSARGFVLDYRGAVIIATDDELSAICNNVPDNSRLRLPGAFVGNLGATETLENHARRMALAGFDRRTFIDVETAHRWVVGMATMRGR